MRLNRALASIILVLGFNACASAEEASCRRAESPEKYRGRMFDAMAQIESRMSDAVLAGMNRSGITGMALFARLHPRRNGEMDALSLKRRFPDRFILGTPKPFDQRDDLSDRFVERTISGLNGGQYHFVGEIMFAHADKKHGEQTATGERYVAPEGGNVHKLLSALQKRHVPVMTHWEVYNWNRDWPAFEALYAAFPDVTFIWPHAGFGSAAQVETVLASRPNVMVTLSKKEKNQLALSNEEQEAKLAPSILDSCDKVLPEWRRLLEKYPDRFMFATDAHKDFRWAKYEDIVNQWRLILGQLPEPLVQRVAWRNAERIYALTK